MSEESLAAVVLAAGGGARFSGDISKLLAPWRGRPLASWAVEAAAASQIGPLWVVTGAAPLDGLLPPGTRRLDNPAWREGQATSLALAVDAARAESLAAIVVGLADQPLVPPAAWRAVAASGALVGVATYGGRRRNPVRLDAAVWDRLPRTGDQGARPLIHGHPELVTEVACEGNPVDIDTVEDLARWS